MLSAKLTAHYQEWGGRRRGAYRIRPIVIWRINRNLSLRRGGTCKKDFLLNAYTTTSKFWLPGPLLLFYHTPLIKGAGILSWRRPKEPDCRRTKLICGRRNLGTVFCGSIEPCGTTPQFPSRTALLLRCSTQEVKLRFGTSGNWPFSLLNQ